MFLNKVFYFLKGYVIIEITGSGSERFLNICLHRGIRLYDINRAGGSVLCRISAADFFMLRPIAKKSGVGVHILKKRSPALFIGRALGRYVFWAGLAVSAAVIILSSRFVWTVDVIGNESVDKAEILAVLERHGVKPGVRLSSLPDGKSLKESVVSEVPRLSWAWVHMKGSKVIAEVREGKEGAPVIDRSKPCDIEAAKDGLITKIITLSGEAVTEAGNAVTAGETVISGIVDTRFKFETEPRRMLTHADGKVYARTYYEESGEYKLFSESRPPTGNRRTVWSAEIFSKTLCPFKGGVFESCSISEERRELRIFGYYTGISLIKTVYTEVDPVKEPIPEDTAAELAKNELEKKISAKLLPGAVKKDEKLTSRRIDDETLLVTLEMEFEEEIGRQAAVKDRALASAD